MVVVELFPRPDYYDTCSPQDKVAVVQVAMAAEVVEAVDEADHPNCADKGTPEQQHEVAVGRRSIHHSSCIAAAHRSPVVDASALPRNRAAAAAADI